MAKVISVRLDDIQERLLVKFAESEGMSVSDFIRDTVFEKIENEMDLKILDERSKNAKENNYKGYSLEQVMNEFDL